MPMDKNIYYTKAKSIEPAANSKSKIDRPIIWFYNETAKMLLKELKISIYTDNCQ